VERSVVIIKGFWPAVGFSDIDHLNERKPDSGGDSDQPEGSSNDAKIAVHDLGWKNI